MKSVLYYYNKQGFDETQITDFSLHDLPELDNEILNFINL